MNQESKSRWKEMPIFANVLFYSTLGKYSERKKSIYIKFRKKMRKNILKIRNSAMKFIFTLFVCLSLMSCRKTKIETYYVDVLTVEEASKDDMSFLDSIKVTPLETMDSALIRTPHSFQYLPDIDKYLIMDNQQIAFIYDRKGKFQSSSMLCIGEGPKQYQIGVDVAYNPYEQTIEILEPTRGGIIHQYDLDFEWIGRKFMNCEKDFVAHSFSLIAKDVYSLAPVRFDDNVYINVIDFSKDSLVSERIKCPKDNYVSEVNMMQKDFILGDSVLYYSPHYMDYHFYSLDLQHKEFKPIYRLHLGDDMLDSDNLEDMFGSLSEDKKSNMLTFQKRNEFLISSDYMLPIIRLINDKFVYVHSIKNKKPFHFIYDRRNGRKYWITNDTEVLLNRCFSIQDDVLYTFVRAYELDKYINQSHYKYISKRDIENLSKVKEDDNPVVIEYHLK